MATFFSLAAARVWILTLITDVKLFQIQVFHDAIDDPWFQSFTRGKKETVIRVKHLPCYLGGLLSLSFKACNNRWLFHFDSVAHAQLPSPPEN